MKRFVLLAMSLMLCFLLAFAAQADPDVIIEPDAAGVPEQVVAQLVADYPDAGLITITHHYTANEATQDSAAADSFRPAPYAATTAGILTVGLVLLACRRKAYTA